MSCTSLEVSCTCTDKSLTLTDNTLTASPAYRAVRIHNNCTCVHEYIKESLFHSLKIYRTACRNYKESYLRSNLFPLMIAAPTLKSSIRPLLHEPRNASSIFTPSDSLAGTTLSTKCGFATIGCIVERSIS